MVREYLIAQGKHLVVYEGDRVGVGEALTDGAINPHDVLHVKGIKEVQEFLVNAIQEVYRLQGVTVSDRHIECIVRQMLQNVKVDNSGDTSFLKARSSTASPSPPRTARRRRRGQGGASRARPSRNHEGLSRVELVHLGRELPGNDARPDPGRDDVADRLPEGSEGNVIIGHMIPAGTGLQAREKLIESPRKPRSDSAVGD